MSGHSKWHNIQKTKGAADAKRAQAFTKIAREMIVAVKEGGSGDPNNNSRLAAVITKAKAANMPNDNIKRTIDKALGAGNTDNYEKIVYEGYGPSGVAVIVETMTDNRNRTAGDMRHYFDKFGKGLGATGITIDQEIARVDEVVARANEKGIPVIAVMLEKDKRSDVKTNSNERCIDAVCPHASWMIVTADVNTDGRYDAFKAENGTPLTILDSSMDFISLVQQAFVKE